MKHTGSYIDPATSLPREFDIRAYVENETVQTRFAIECKAISAPLIVSRVLRRTPEECDIFTLKEDEINRQFTMRYPLGNPDDGFVGKSMDQFSKTKGGYKQVRSKDDSIYSKWAQALSSSEDLLKDPPIDRRLMIVPVVVVPDDQLWFVDYDNEGEVIDEPKQGTWCACSVGHELRTCSPFRLTHLEVWTFSAIKECMWWYMINGGN